MTDLIRIPFKGGYVDITLLLLGLIILVGALLLYRHYEKKDQQ